MEIYTDGYTLQLNSIEYFKFVSFFQSLAGKGEGSVGRVILVHRKE